MKKKEQKKPMYGKKPDIPSGKNLAIERVNNKNFNEFAGLIRELARYENLAPPTPEALGRLKTDCTGKKPRIEAYVAYLGKEPVAYLILLYTYSSFLARPTLFIEDIFVLEKYRGSGIGKKLWTFIEKRAKANRCARIEFIVLDWNTSAQGFYKKQGAKKLDWFFYRKKIHTND